MKRARMPNAQHRWAAEHPSRMGASCEPVEWSDRDHESALALRAQQLALQVLVQGGVATVPGNAFELTGIMQPLPLIFACHIDEFAERLRSIVGVLAPVHTYEGVQSP